MKVYCPNCGNEIENNQQFCSNCGRKLKDTSKIKCILMVVLSTFLCVSSFTVVSGFMYKNNTLKNIIPSALNCKYYKDYDLTDEVSASGYFQCTLDEKIKPLNECFKFDEQEDYWNDLNSIIEHTFENKVKYQNQQPDLIGKYNTLDKIHIAFYKEYTLYELGKIATGKAEYVGPDYMFGEGTWAKYYDGTKSENKDFRKLSSIEQLKLAQKLQKLSDYISDKFSDNYNKNVFILNLMGIEYNATNHSAKKILKNTIEKICGQDGEKYIDTLTRKNSEEDTPVQIQENPVLDKLESEETCTKVGEHLYFDQGAINIQTDLIGGVFKEYNYNNDKSYNEKNYAYKTIQTMAYCDIVLQGGIKKIEFPIFKYYDKNNKLVDEYNIHEIWRKEYPDGHLGITHPEDEPNGEIYFNTLCKYYSPKK